MDNMRGMEIAPEAEDVLIDNWREISATDWSHATVLLHDAAKAAGREEELDRLLRIRLPGMRTDARIAMRGAMVAMAMHDILGADWDENAYTLLMRPWDAACTLLLARGRELDQSDVVHTNMALKQLLHRLKCIQNTFDYDVDQRAFNAGFHTMRGAMLEAIHSFEEKFDGELD